LAGGYFYTTTLLALAGNQALPMTTTGATYSSPNNPAPTLAADGGVQLSAGTYVVSYTISADAAASDEEVEEILTLGGTQIPGSSVVQEQPNLSNGFLSTASGTITITVPAGGAELVLHNGPNPTDTSVNTLDPAGTVVYGRINVQKVA
jgi:hypothetical protein